MQRVILLPFTFDPFISLSGFFRCMLIILPLLFLTLSGCSDGSRPAPQAVAGVIDLRDWDFHRDGALDLDGDYEFYWQQLLSGADFRNATHSPDGFRQIPDIWNKDDGAGSFDHYGYATYRLQIKLAEAKLPLTFRFQDAGTSCRVFANGEEIYAAGHPGKMAESSTPAYQPALVDYYPHNTNLELVIQVANFHHRDGGLWLPIKLGRESDLREANLRRMLIDTFLFAGIFIIGCYYMGMFIIRQREVSYLYFALFCQVVAVRSLVSGNKILAELLPQIPWSVLVKMDYAGFGLSIPVFALFLSSLFPRDFPGIAKTVVVSIGFTFSIIALLFPVSASSQVLPIYQLFMIACFTLGLYVLIKAIMRQEKGTKILLVGYMGMFYTALNDMLQLYGLLPANNLIMFGMFFFIFSQAVFLALRFNKAFVMLEEHQAELAVTNLNYRRELSERKHAESMNHQLQEKLNRSRKMEALGILAGTVAHDLNNVLNAMVGYPDYLLLDLPPDSPLVPPIIAIRKSGFEAEAIVKDLLTLARRNVVQMAPVNLNNIIEEYFTSPKFYSLQAHHPHVSFEYRLAENLPNIIGSKLHLRKTLMNLIANAAEAQKTEGKVFVSTESVYLDSPKAGYQDIAKGSYCICTVKDEGTGISADDLAHIFEPFYTTKEMGRSGTGLGMAVVWGTMEDHNGYIDIHSVEGEGTRFDLYIATTTRALDKASAEIPVEEYLGAGEKILVIDDVEEQREIARRILSRLGYQVEALESGEAAIEYCKSNQTDLLILDMIMAPGMDGLETYRQILQLQPQQAAIIASGFSETDRVKAALDSGAGEYLKKPYTIEKIGLAVKRELARKADGKDEKQES